MSDFLSYNDVYVDGQQTSEAKVRSANDTVEISNIVLRTYLDHDFIPDLSASYYRNANAARNMGKYELAGILQAAGDREMALNGGAVYREEPMFVKVLIAAAVIAAATGGLFFYINWLMIEGLKGV